MKWLISLLVLSVATTLTVYQLSFFNKPIGSSQQVMSKIEGFMQGVPSLPRYMEGGYSPLGRSPIVDALLADPLYGPKYAQNVAEKIKSERKLYELTSSLFSAAAIPLSESKKLPISNTPPEKFLIAFPTTANKLHSYWLSFLEIERDVEGILSPLSQEEKNWVKAHYEAFFFGENRNDYDFFTTDSVYPLRFFELASKIDLAKLSDCATRLCLIADDFIQSKETFAQIMLKDDFIWEENNLKFIVSQKSQTTQKENADFFIDLGGFNTVHNNAGGTEGIRNLALHLDLKGHNNYQGSNFVQGSGVLGVGMLVSCGGNNTYNADAYSQGCGFFGSGILVNIEGNNRFSLNFGGQSFALFGSSLLWDKKGHNEYLANYGMAQAASSTLGVAFLIDNEGNNTYTSGVRGKKGTSRYGGIGQGGSTGVRYNPWLNNPSFYGGLSYLYIGGGDNKLKTVWIGQGSAYFMGAGILVSEGSNDVFEADYDAQGQGLHLAYGLLLKKGDNNTFNGGWGSLGVAGDRSAGLFISTGKNNTFIGTDQAIGSSRKPQAVGIFINEGGNNNYSFKKISNARIEFPQSPKEWSSALFVEVGSNSLFPENVDEFKRGNDLEWGIENHSLGLSTNEISDLSSLFHNKPFPRSSTAYKPIAIDPTLAQSLVNEILSADYDRRRQIYETLDLFRFKNRKIAYDLSYILNNPLQSDVDAFNYAVLWALRNKDKTDLTAIKRALEAGSFKSDYSRKMAVSLVGTYWSDQSVPLLINAMENDPSEEIRYYAALSLALHLSPNSIDAIKQNLKSSSELVRFAIAKGLQENSNPQALTLVLPLLKDESFYVRRAAGLSAISLGDKSGIPVVLETLQFDSLDTTDNYGDNIFNHLSTYLDVNFGLDKKAWINWWEQVKDTYQIPASKPSPQN